MSRPYSLPTTGINLSTPKLISVVGSCRGRDMMRGLQGTCSRGAAYRCRRSRGRGRDCRCANSACAARNETPRTADGKPDLTGAGRRWWRRRGRSVVRRGLEDWRNYRKGNPTNGEARLGLEQRVGPSYRSTNPEHWERVDYLEPCMSRIRVPLHACRGSADRAADQDHADADRARVMYQARNTWRVIPVDGRPHDPVNSRPDVHGRLHRPVGGDTLVVDVVGFNERAGSGGPATSTRRHARRGAPAP